MASHARRRERHLSHRAGWLVRPCSAQTTGSFRSRRSSSVLPPRTRRLGDRDGGVAGLVAARPRWPPAVLSVSSQSDTERADLALERRELSSDPIGERAELAGIYRERGSPPARRGGGGRAQRPGGCAGCACPRRVGHDRAVAARPFQAAGASAASFTVGAALPLLAVIVAPSSLRIAVTIAATWSRSG